VSRGGKETYPVGKMRRQKKRQKEQPLTRTGGGQGALEQSKKGGRTVRMPWPASRKKGGRGKWVLKEFHKGEQTVCDKELAKDA